MRHHCNKSNALRKCHAKFLWHTIPIPSYTYIPGFHGRWGSTTFGVAGKLPGHVVGGCESVMAESSAPKKPRHGTSLGFSTASIRRWVQSCCTSLAWFVDQMGLAWISNHKGATVTGITSEEVKDSLSSSWSGSDRCQNNLDQFPICQLYRILSRNPTGNSCSVYRLRPTSDVTAARNAHVFTSKIGGKVPPPTAIGSSKMTWPRQLDFPRFMGAYSP